MKLSAQKWRHGDAPRFEFIVTRSGVEGQHPHVQLDTLLLTTRKLRGNEPLLDIKHCRSHLFGVSEDINFALLKLRPSLRWALGREGKGGVRAFFAKNPNRHESETSEATKNIISKCAEAGFNLVWMHSGGWRASAETLQRIEERLQEAKAHGIQVLPSFYQHFGAADQLYVNEKGETLPDPHYGLKRCPVDADNFKKAYFATLAKPLIELRRRYPQTLVGVAYDIEGGIRRHCYCQSCYEGFLRFKQIPSSHAGWHQLTKQRRDWLEGKGFLEEFWSWEAKQVERQARLVRERVQQLDPDFAFGITCWQSNPFDSDTWFSTALVNGLSTAQVPVFLHGGSYWYGYSRALGHVEQQMRKLVKQLGYLPFLVCSQSFLAYFEDHTRWTPEQSGREVYEACRRCRGVLVYHDTYENYEKDFAMDYWKQWRRGFEQLMRKR